MSVGPCYDWQLAKRMWANWHPLAQFNVFVEATSRPPVQDDTVDAFVRFCAYWEPICERLLPAQREFVEMDNPATTETKGKE